MSGYKACLDAINGAAGRDLSAEELDDLMKELDRRIAQQERIGGLDDLDEMVRRAADDYAAEMAAKAKIAKRNAAIQLKTRLEVLDKIRSQFAKNPSLGVESVLTGVNSVTKGSRNSAALAQLNLRNKYLQLLYTELKRENVVELFNSGALDEQAAEAMWAMNRAVPVEANVSKEAVAIAKAVTTAQEKARLDTNNAGGWIKRLEGYVTRQSHDSYKISRAGYEGWRDFIKPRLDLARTLDGSEDPESFLKAVYRGLATGVHMRTVDQGGFRGPPNIAKRDSQERVLHFKDAKSWTQYNREFGRGSLHDSVLASLSKSAQDTGLMRRLGPNPEANLNVIIDTMKQEIKDESLLKKFSSDANGKLRNRYAEVSGLTRTPVNATAASWSSTVRTGQSMAKLGASLFAQFGDIPAFGSELHYQGDGMLSGMARSLVAIGQRVHTEERDELWSALGIFFDSMSGGTVNRFSLPDDGVPGAVAKSEQLFFKLNGMTAWSDRQRAGAIHTFSSLLATDASKDFGRLSPERQRVLSLYGVGERQWKILRQAVETTEDGKKFMTTRGVQNLPDSVFEDFLREDGIKPTANRIETAREEVSDQLRSYLLDRADYAQLVPDARVRSMMNRGTRPGTMEGELLRFIGQFKSFSLAVVVKLLGRELYGRGAPVDATFFQALRSGNGEMLGLANLILTSALFGYGSMVAKDLVKGRTPRPPLSPATWGAALAQGGGLGIYGDFLFGQANRFGGGLVQTAAGPTLGTAEDVKTLYDILTSANQPHRAREAAAQAFRFGLDNTPFINLFYTRVVLDYLLFYRVSEALSPGYIQRMQRRVEKENNQIFLVRPSQMVH